MQYSAIDHDYMVYVEKNEKIMDTLTKFCKEKEILNAQLSGIGAVKAIELGAYDLGNREYTRQYFDDAWELVSYQGNVTLKEDKPFIHAHITISNHDMNTRGGHLFGAKVAVVGEFFLRTVDNTVHRQLNNDVGLPTWCLLERVE